MKKLLFALLVVGIVGVVYVLFYTPAAAPTPEPADSQNTTATTTPATAFVFVCSSNDQFSISYTNGGDNATLTMSGRDYELTRARSGSGARYTNADESIVFWEHQGTASIEEEGVALLSDCPLQSNVTEVPTASSSGDVSGRIVISSPQPNTAISNPVTVTGMARGTWYFEASFPIEIVDWDGKIIGEGYATADGDWMTTEFVPFTGTVTYTLPEDTPYTNGAVIFKKDNPSGLPENDAAIEVPVKFE